MKNLKIACLCCVIGIFQACNSGSNDSVSEAKDANEKKDSSSMTAGTPDTNKTVVAMPVDKMDADFAVEAANGGMMEVELGNYAVQNALSQRVKDFGAMMVRDHTKGNDQLKQLAGARNITLPQVTGADEKKTMDDLMKKKGKDFDKAYMDMMIDDHKKDIHEFEKAVKDCKDSEIKDFATKTLPVLQMHLDSCKAIAGKH